MKRKRLISSTPDRPHRQSNTGTTVSETAYFSDCLAAPALYDKWSIARQYSLYCRATNFLSVFSKVTLFPHFLAVPRALPPRVNRMRAHKEKRSASCRSLPHIYALLAPAAFQTASERVKKVRRPQKQYNAKKETVNFRFFLFELLKMRLALAWSVFCFLRRAPLTVSIYAYRGALLAPAAFQTASERVKNIVF